MAQQRRQREKDPPKPDIPGNFNPGGHGPGSPVNPGRIDPDRWNNPNRPWWAPHPSALPDLIRHPPLQPIDGFMEGDWLDDRWYDGPDRPAHFNPKPTRIFPDYGGDVDPNRGHNRWGEPLDMMPLGAGQAPPPGIPPWSDSSTGEPEQQGSIDPRTPKSAARDWEAPQPVARAPKPAKKRTSGGVKGPSKRGAARGGRARSVRRSGPRVGGA